MLPTGYHNRNFKMDKASGTHGLGYQSGRMQATCCGCPFSKRKGWHWENAKRSWNLYARSHVARTDLKGRQDLRQADSTDMPSPHGHLDLLLVTCLHILPKFIL